MKNFIITIAAIILLVTLLIFQEDVNRIRRDVGRAQNALNQGISTALLLSTESEKAGKLQYDKGALEKAYEIIGDNIPKSLDYSIVLKEDERDRKNIEMSLEMEVRSFNLKFLSSKKLKIKLEGSGGQIIH